MWNEFGRFSYKCWFESNFATSNLYPWNSKIIVRRCLILVFLSYVIFSLEAALFSEIWIDPPYCDNILFQVNHVRTQRLIFLRIVACNLSKLFFSLILTKVYQKKKNLNINLNIKRKYSSNYLTNWTIIQL